ncbi:hypothetical protein ElyMa_002136200 [Elysia marginata]|uniref:Uncharacterized protein n=1 Tax=Elysia marginata TaxID=1093978 RepID=A0AAV4FM00_9GAST|nr:hypothetical protein ElyMa_002136200 [Elysia marginata]
MRPSSPEWAQGSKGHFARTGDRIRDLSDSGQLPYRLHCHHINSQSSSYFKLITKAERTEKIFHCPKPGALRAWVPMTIYGLPPRYQRGYHDSVSAGHIILTPTQPVGARTVLGCVSNPRPLGHRAKPLPTELSRPLFC